MTNPFDQSNQTNYSQNICDQISSAQIGIAFSIDISPKTIFEARSVIAYVCKRKLQGFKFITREDADGKLWVKRIL